MGKEKYVKIMWKIGGTTIEVEELWGILGEIY
jgi:hypothetical protein